MHFLLLFALKCIDLLIKNLQVNTSLPKKVLYKILLTAVLTKLTKH